MNDKWVKKWNVPGNNGNTWVVAIDKDGNYGCSCPVWKFKRKECKHIVFVKNGGGDVLEGKRFETVFEQKDNKQDLWVGRDLQLGDYLVNCYKKVKGGIRHLQKFRGF